MDAILVFSGRHRWLSNFYEHPVTFEGVVYPSVEHAYQAAKTANPQDRAPFTSGTPGQAKRRGRALKLRSDWEGVKVDVMLALLRVKFKHAGLAHLLRGTGDAHLEEGNTWGDTFWGVCNGQGQNTLGRLLMQVRAELREVK
jgi:ribA/ribD-fused uncharacterized protein